MKDGGNWYTYCGNDPVNRTDPSGYKTAEGGGSRDKLSGGVDAGTKKSIPKPTPVLPPKVEAVDTSFTSFKGVDSAFTNESSTSANADLDLSKPFDLGKGWEGWFDPENKSKGEQKHVHVEKDKKNWSQNQDGSDHKTNPTEPLPKKVKKKLKEQTGWDWDAKEKEYNDMIFVINFYSSTSESSPYDQAGIDMTDYKVTPEGYYYFLSETGPTSIPSYYFRVVFAY